MNRSFEPCSDISTWGLHALTCVGVSAVLLILLGQKYTTIFIGFGKIKASHMQVKRTKYKQLIAVPGSYI